MLKKQVEAIKQANENIEGRIDGLEKEIQQKTAEKSRAEGRYRKMLLEDSSGTTLHSTSELSQVKQSVESLSLEIQVANERLDMLNAGKHETLRKLLPAVEEARNKELEGLNADIERIHNEARELRAQLTLKILEANAPFTKAKELLSELNSVEYMSGITAYDRRTSGVGVPEKPKLKDYYQYGGAYISDLCVIPEEKELLDAYAQGIIPAWIQHYADTGKLVTNAQAKEIAEKGTSKKEGRGLVNRLLNK